MIADENENIIDESTKEEVSAETLENIYQHLTHAADIENTTDSENLEDISDKESDDKSEEK